ncbi:MAG: ribonuclease toxin HepT-like protein [Spirochaetota bacterium]
MDKKEFQEDLGVELDNLKRLEDEMKTLLGKISDNPGFIETRGVASILHDFYSGIEKIFERIALYIDGNLPKGEEWHRELLLQMAKPFRKRKKAVISEELFQKLKEYLRFRHLFRHIYGFELKWNILRPLSEEMENVLNKIRKEIESFLRNLNKGS